ncbi:hypothetical protein PIB30_007167 [Stylosanthes scabra]|uniref:ZF-HD dimerization-type domain-containing protein n=1 Tax=Stylosanthes scabra TaxID=79078 RepID=A0ABU6U400_9FABA|nr:hypothetical protein [Stylosanthes scabra]
MERRRGEEEEEDRELEMATATATVTAATTTLGSYSVVVPNNNRDDSSSTSSKLSSPTLVRASEERTRQPSLLFHHHHHHPPLQHLYPHLRPTTTDPDLTSSPIATTAPHPPQAAATTTTTTISVIRYRECLRNHAASMGSHVVDGCGEFMPSGEEGTPESLRCAACECHRNFHRREVEGSSQQHHSYYPKHNGHTAHLVQFHTPPPSSSLHHQRFSHAPASAQPVMMAFGGGGAAESSSEDLNMFHHSNALGGQFSVQQASGSKKRFRTKFTQQQKDRMMEFAEKIGWKIQKQDEQQVQQFCSQAGVKRQVFKVWMHNNKQASKKQQHQQ